MQISNSIDNTERLAEVFAAIAHPLRIRIVRTLMHHPMCVSRLVAALEAPQSSVSRALAMLRKAGLVRRERCGAFTRYVLTDTLGGEPTAALHDLIAALVPDTYDEEATRRRLAAQGIEPPPTPTRHDR